MTNHDREVLEALREDPELLAIADAVVETQSIGRVRPRTTLVGIALAAAALFVLVLASPWDHGGGSATLLERAAAAVGDEPVLHVITQQTRPADWQFVDLATGERTRPDVTTSTELWYDPGRSLAHTISRVDGRVTDDTLQTPDGVHSREGVVYTCAWIQAHPVEATRKRISCRFDGDNGTVPHQVLEPPPIVDPGLSGFLTGYQQALENGTAREVGEGTIDGRSVVWLEMHLVPPRPPGADRDLEPIDQRVAIDRESYRPLRVVPSNGTPYDIARIETLSREEGDFTEPKPAPPETLVSGGSVISSSDIGLDEARSLIGARAFWAGQTAHGLPLTKTTHDVIRTRYAESSGLEPQTSDGLTLEYGSGEQSLTIRQGADPLAVYNWPSRGGLWPTPPGGKARIGPFDWAYLVRDGVYVTIMSPLGEAVVLETARALEPIP